MNNFDLHNHTNASDGLLTATDVVHLAARHQCDGLAITDHDTLDALEEARQAAALINLRLINGVEISVSWAASEEMRPITIHIVGLNIDDQNEQLVNGLRAVREGRIERAQRMGAALEAMGIPGMFDAAIAMAKNHSMIGRTHFARALVASGHAKNVNAVFSRFLTPGKPGYVPHRWTSLADAVQWISGAGGVAVVAHPGRYNLDRTEMRQLLSAFKDLGGQAIEVVTGSHRPGQCHEFAALAREYQFHASRGADFHGDDANQPEPGTMPPLPDGLKPVWSMWQ